jgi:hypothetical protein
MDVSLLEIERDSGKGGAGYDPRPLMMPDGDYSTANARLETDQLGA